LGLKAWAKALDPPLEVVDDAQGVGADVPDLVEDLAEIAVNASLTGMDSWAMAPTPPRDTFRTRRPTTRRGSFWGVV
jgi:hypothetical protein